MKRRLLSLFIAISMIASLIAIPTVVSAYANDTLVIDMEITNGASKGSFNLNFGLDPDNASIYYIAVYSKKALEIEDGEEVPADSNMASRYDVMIQCGSPGEVTNPDGLNADKDQAEPIIRRTKNLNSVPGKKESIPFTVDESLYNDSFYVLYCTDTASGKANQGVRAYEIADGRVKQPQHNITLDPNGGAFASGVTAPTSINAGTYTQADFKTAIGIADNKVTREGYNFVGWSTNASATAEDVSFDLTDVDNTTPTTIYAVWSEKATWTADDFEAIAVRYTGAERTATVQKKSTATGTAGAITVTANGKKTNAGTYTVTFDVAESDTHKKATGLTTSWTVNKAAYTATPTRAAVIGEKIIGAEIPVEINGVIAADKKTGTATITAGTGLDANSVVAADTDYNNLTWTLSGATLDTTNYEEFTGGTNASLTRVGKETVNPNITGATNKTYDGNPTEAKAEPKVGAAALDAQYYTVKFTKDGADVTGTPTDAGTYNIVFELTDAGKAKYTVNGTTTAEFTIAQKPLEIVYPENITKVADGDKTVMIGTNPMALTDLSIKPDSIVSGDDVKLAVDGTFKAEYADANAGNNKKITISGVKLDGAKKDNYKLPTLETVGNIEGSATAAPTDAPTAAPTAAPTDAPTAAPTAAPTDAPTAAPTAAPTDAPTAAPTATPTSAPTEAPTATPVPKHNVTGTESKNGTYKVVVGDTEYDPTSTAAPIEIAEGEEVTVVTTPDKGYKLDKIKVTLTNGTEVPVASGKFTMPDGDATINVTFKKSTPTGGGGGGNSGFSTGGNPTSTPSPTATAKPEETAAPTATPIEGTQAHTAYVYGYEDGDFRPQNGITRAETAAIFARALTSYVEGASYTGSMSDVDGSEWYANYVNYLTGVNVITGYEDGTFRPDASISRREFTAMITRLGNVVSAGDMNLSDVEADDWAIDNIYTAYTNGLVNGYEDGTFRPDNNITRAEAVKIVNAYLKRGVDAAGLANADYTTFPDVSTSFWAYYEIIEAANNHIFEEGTLPEVWVK